MRREFLLIRLTPLFLALKIRTTQPLWRRDEFSFHTPIAIARQTVDSVKAVLSEGVGLKLQIFSVSRLLPSPNSGAVGDDFDRHRAASFGETSSNFRGFVTHVENFPSAPLYSLFFDSQ